MSFDIARREQFRDGGFSAAVRPNDFRACGFEAEAVESSEVSVVVEGDFIEPKEPGQPVRRAFVTLTVYL